MSTNTFLQKYKILNKIGEGSFSEVLKCRDKRTGEYLAAKRLKKKFKSIDEVFGCAEIIAMQKISRHKNILYMKEFHFDPFLGKLTYLFELMDMSLYDFLRIRKRPVPEPRAKNYLHQMLSGLAHIHKNGLFHRDIKPENVLIRVPLEQTPPFRSEVVKIADLGSIRGIYSRPPYTEYISTRWYRSPECLLTAGYYGLKMDVWAAGCVFYETLTLRPLFPGSNELDQLARIHSVIGTPGARLLAKLATHKSCNCRGFPRVTGTGLAALLPGISPDGHDVLRLMLAYDPDVRVTVKRLLEHRYFACFRPLQRRSSFAVEGVRSTLPQPAGDVRRVTDKYVTSTNRASQNDVLGLHKTNIMSSAILKPPQPVPSKLKSTSLGGRTLPKDAASQQLYRPLGRDCSHRNTTSNIPQLVHRPEPRPNKLLVLDNVLRSIKK